MAGCLYCEESLLSRSIEFLRLVYYVFISAPESKVFKSEPAFKELMKLIGCNAVGNDRSSRIVFCRESRSESNYLIAGNRNASRSDSRIADSTVTLETVKPGTEFCSQSSFVCETVFNVDIISRYR